jgi:hypothetical protein
MSTDRSPSEGSIFVLSYTEADYDSKDTAALVYILRDGRLQPLLGVLDLPMGICWNLYDSTNYDWALQIIQNQKVFHVFTPQYTAQNTVFFGQKLGFELLSNQLNDRGEIECWFELGAFTANWEFMYRLETSQIKVIEIDPETHKIVK